MKFAALLVASLALGSAHGTVAAEPGAPAPGPVARGDDKDKREQARREEHLKRIGADFEAMNTPALVKRIPEGAKVTLGLGRTSGAYSADQARQVLDDYFDQFRSLTVTFSKAESNVGSFDLVLRRKGEDRERKRNLLVTVGGADAKPPFPLVEISVR